MLSGLPSGGACPSPLPFPTGPIQNFTPFVVLLCNFAHAHLHARAQRLHARTHTHTHIHTHIACRCAALYLYQVCKARGPLGPHTALGSRVRPYYCPCVRELRRFCIVIAWMTLFVFFERMQALTHVWLDHLTSTHARVATSLDKPTYLEISKQALTHV